MVTIEHVPLLAVDSEAEIHSFAIRFVQEGQSDVFNDWHAHTLYIQANEEHKFAKSSEAMAFIEQYVKLRADPPHPQPNYYPPHANS